MNAEAKPLLNETTSFADINIVGERFSCGCDGALFWKAEQTLIVSDLHLEKGSSFASKGKFLPPYDTGETLDRLKKCVVFWKPKRIISLGDSFHDALAHNRLPDQYLAQLKAIMSDKEWVWISGNHDPIPPEELGGICAHELNLGSITFRHEPLAGQQEGEIAGHLHPKAKIIRRSKGVTRPCFANDKKRLIMPAFGAFTGGLNIKHQAFSGLFDESNINAVLLGKDRVFHIGGTNLVP